jgi:hypothetical protein
LSRRILSDYEADDEHNGGDHNGGDHEKAEQHAPTCEGHDVPSEFLAGVQVLLGNGDNRA